jgi:hypothetical protein
MRIRLQFALLVFPSLVWAPVLVWAQDTVAPTTGESTLPSRGENAGNYNVVQSWEFGYRFASVGGDDGKYRSDVNYGNGIRLLSGNLTVNSRDGKGRWFDEIVLTTQGLGNDPYESATFRIQKNRWYRYDLLWRSNDYFNPGLTVADGEHLEDTTFRWQNHDLTLFPQSWFRARVGYSRTTQDGPALTTEQEFDSQSAVFPLFRNTRQEYNEYRLGGDIVLKGFRLSVLHRWEYFKEDTTDNLTQTEQIGPSELTGFARAQPYRGRTPGWLVSLAGEYKWIALNGRFTYAGGRGNVIQNESFAGIDRFSNPQNVQVLVTGNGDRPVISGDLNVTLFPSSRLSFTNNTSVSDTRMTGNNSFEQFNNATFTAQVANFQFLGVLLITNSTDIRYRFSKKLDVFAGYRYSDRQIRSTEAGASLGSTFNTAAEQSNQLRAGVAGVSWMPLKDLRVHLEAEIGSNDHAFAPISQKNYDIIRARVQYRRKNYSLDGSYLESYNNNSILITAYSSHSRTYTANASWNAKSWVSLDASYSKLHLDTIGGLAFFAGSPALLNNAPSIFISNIHSGNLGLRFALTAHADLYVGYNITKDTGDSRFSDSLAQTTPAGQLLYSVQTFPLTYQTPLVRISIKVTPKLRYNVGYQYYGYHEEFGVLDVNQNYRAHTGYTSLLWSF